ncbi:MAG: MFS transporter, partial [Planctomycetaceae bacterium]
MTLLTAVNDSMFRWMIMPVGRGVLQSRFSLSTDEAGSVILALGLGIFMLPFVIFAPWAGWASDRFSKRSSIICMKVAELLLVFVGVFSIRLDNVVLMFLVLFLLGVQATLIGTTKLGIIPEIVRRRDISSANGWSGLATLVGVIVGTVAGYGLGDSCVATPARGHFLALLSLAGTAVFGLVGAIMIRRVPAANPEVRFHWNLVTDSLRDASLIVSHKQILRITLGIVFFWSIASMAQMSIDVFVRQELADNLDRANPSPFMAMLVIGVGVGSLLAGWWSCGRVELGMVPFGTLLMGLSCIVLFFTVDSPILAGLMLMLIGLGGGLFNVPLQAWLQERAPHEKLGRILASCQQLTALGMMGVAGLFWFLREQLDLSASQIFLISGLTMIPVAAYVIRILPQATIRFFVWILSRSAYRVRTFGVENLPEQGPGLLVANHVTWIDGILILLASSRPIRMIAYADYVEGPLIGRLARLFGIIPIRTTDGTRALLKSLRDARDALMNGELVCIFAEGAITRTGQLMRFERGMLHILRGTNAPVIPVCLDELWGSLF